MTSRAPTIQGWLVAALALAAAVFVPALLPGREMHTGLARPLTAGDWTWAVLLLTAPLAASFVAWHKRPFPDRVCAVASLLLTLWVLYRFLNWLS